MLSNISIKENILADEKYRYLFSVEEVNKRVLQGVPFRDAYKQVGIAIEEGKFTNTTDIHHVHEGSIGNLCNDNIAAMMQQTLKTFEFEKIHVAIKQLLNS